MSTAPIETSKAPIETSKAPIEMLRGPLRDFVEIPFVRHESMESIEVQSLELPSGQTGHMVKIQHAGGVVDLYVEPHLGLTEQHLRSDPAFTHLEIASVNPTDFRTISLQTSATHARCSADFDDRHGRALFLDVAATRSRPAKPTFIPAPPQRNPRTFRLLHVDSFWLLPKASSSITLRYGDTTLAPAGFPNVSIARFWSGRVGTGNHLVGVNLDQPHPHLVGAEHVFRVEDRAAPNAAFAIVGPLGCVADGTHSTQSGELTLQITSDWRPPLTRPVLRALSVVRRLRRRSERWVWRSGTWSN